MVMNAIKRVVDFGAGVAVGAIAGAGVAYLTAPRSGDDLRKEGQELVDSAVSAGERARVDREAELRDKFRMQVDKRDALTSSPDNAVLGTETPQPAVPFPS
jgi:gas vesicle protein